MSHCFCSSCSCLHLVLLSRSPQDTPNIVTAFPTSLANGYATYYWGGGNGRGMGFDDVTVPLENPSVSVNISANIIISIIMMIIASSSSPVATS